MLTRTPRPLSDRARGLGWPSCECGNNQSASSHSVSIYSIRPPCVLTLETHGNGLSISGTCTGTFIFEVGAPTAALGPSSPALVAWVDGYSIGHDSHKRSAPGLAVGALPGRPKIGLQ